MNQHSVALNDLLTQNASEIKFGYLDGEGNSLLMTALNLENVDMFALVLEKALESGMDRSDFGWLLRKPNAKNETPLIKICLLGNDMMLCDLIALLQSNVSKPNQIRYCLRRDNENMAALDYATNQNRYFLQKILRFHQNSFKANNRNFTGYLNDPKKDGSTLLVHAIHAGLAENVKLLLDSGANPTQKSNGFLPIQIISENYLAAAADNKQKFLEMAGCIAARSSTNLFGYLEMNFIKLPGAIKEKMLKANPALENLRHAKMDY